MFDPKSDYALNKKEPNAIVYIDSEGTLTRLTSEDFASTEEFHQWKAWSDTDYHELEKKNHIFSNHTVPTAGEGILVQSPEDILIEAQDQQDRLELRRLLMVGLDSCLTPTQRRRIWLYCVDELTEDAIALAENVKQQSVSECLWRAKEKLKKFLDLSL